MAPPLLLDNFCKRPIAQGWRCKRYTLDAPFCYLAVIQLIQQAQGAQAGHCSAQGVPCSTLLLPLRSRRRTAACQLLPCNQGYSGSQSRNMISRIVPGEADLMEHTAQNKAFALQPGVPVQQLHWHLLRSRKESLMSGSQLLHMPTCMSVLTP